MNLEGERRLPAGIEQAWIALNDPLALKSCITGCESLELTGQDEYTAVLALRIGPVNARFKGRLRLLNIQAPVSYTIEFDGQGGVAGFGKGAADVSLVAEGDETVLRYTAKAQVGGKIAQIGSRLIDSAAEKIAGEFFSAFEKYLLESRTETLATAVAVPETGLAPVAEATAAGAEPGGTPAPGTTAAPGVSAAPGAVAAPSGAKPTAVEAGPQPAGIPWGWVAIGAAVGALATWLLTR